MPTALIPPLLLLLGALTARARHLTRSPSGPRSRGGRGSDAGATTLELVIIALGLIAVATLLVVAITAAVTRRTNQIN
jgi:hypothetical protein